jgi:ABC-type transporter Mla MlaB component
MTPKRITVCEDETFHPEICLVAIEPVSNFILLEEYAEGRDAETWTAALNQALLGLPVRVIQSTSDEGKGLLRHVQSGLSAHHSPDIFHVQQDLSRATSIALAGQVRNAQKTVSEATKQTEAQQAQKAKWDQTEHGPGRPPDFEARIAQAKAAEVEAQQELDVARERQESAHRAIRAISTSYHPVDLTTGALRTTEQVTAELESHFTDIKTIATEASLPERSLKGIDKAHRVLSALDCTMTFFHSEVDAHLDTQNLPPPLAQVVKQTLVPAAYLEKAARKAKPADSRPPLLDLAGRLNAEAQPKLAELSEEQRTAIAKAANDCADIFQRSSSCVEGRNGQLSLCHHSLHNLSPARLEALTAVHNYFIQLPNGTTAAERFFGHQPAKMFPWLLENLDMPARPATKRNGLKITQASMLN